MKKRWKILFILFLIIIFLFINALAYKKGNPTLVVDTVGINQLITGYLNISLENETGNKEIKAVIKNVKFSSLTLFELLNKTNLNYDCYYENKKVNCEIIFKEEGKVNIFNGVIGENYVGLVLNGENVSVENLSFEIFGNSFIENCGKIPLTIDFFFDKEKDYFYVNPSEVNDCSLKFPENFEYSEDALITQDWYCDKINLKYTSGKVKIGGIIKCNNFSTTGTLFFKIKTPKGITKECNTTQYNNDYNEVSCDIDIFVEEGIYEVCVRSNVSDTFFIQYDGNKGHFGLFVAEYKNKEISGIITFNSTIYYEQTGKNLIEEINNYLTFKYNKNCSSGCVIPIFINSTQNFELQNLNFKFKTGGIIRVVNNFSIISIKYPKIDSKGFISIPLDAFNLTSPSTVGNYTLEIYLEGEKIESKDFRVEYVPIIQAIIPNEVMVNEETEFRVIAYSLNRTIINYKIDWGDGSSDSNNNGIFRHTYSGEGIYQVIVTVIDSGGFSGIGRFNIKVGISKNILNSSINKALEDIKNFENKLALKFYKNWLIEILEINQTKNKLNTLLQNLQSGNLSSIKIEYDSLKNKIPSTIYFISYPKITYRVNWEEIDLDNVNLITDSCLCEESSCKKGIAIWNDEKLKIGGEKIVITFYDKTTKKFTIINLNLGVEGNIIVELPSSEIYTYVDFKDLQNAIAFNTTSIEIAYNADINPYQIIVYGLPKNMGEIPCEETEGEPTLYEKTKNIFPILALILLILVIVGLIIIWVPYLIKNLKIKEKEKERKLFPYGTDYYNLFNFISNSLRSGKKENEIKEQLIKAGWKKEQIDYVIKKVKKTVKIK